MPQMGGWILRNGQLIKFSYMAHKMNCKLDKLTDTKVQKKGKKGTDWGVVGLGF
jgi:hypothetical protein